MASTKCKVESGIQLLVRLTKKSGIERFYPTVFGNGPNHGDFIEIYSEESTACLLAEFICESLIPNELGGPEASIIVFNTDGKLTLDYLINVAKNKILKLSKDNTNKSSNDTNKLLNSILKNLFILDTYETTQFYISIQNLDFFLIRNPNISLIIFDTLTAFYWEEQNLQKVSKMDLYLKKLLRMIYKVVKDFKVTVMYSRPEYFSTSKEPIEKLEPCCEFPVIEQINYRIQIVYNDNGQNHIHVRTYDKEFKIFFNIHNGEIMWM
ncbi:DNA repair protein XRCC2-like [Nymphalis io]|uniref:DNA repair protein XRCC2-like n=1 Tax=Inachis io TaxID=171585 RepID=UPI002167C251|nr:DNA repair protein XRCC2-like [Nymphalis io]